ncbi:MAG: KPN_02809 family neutral zinc metallopeptidase [Verrucomicrobiales bacterium]|nr:neutral zinc metallopeptidase [Verrucomicrobiota bacterium JB025]
MKWEGRRRSRNIEDRRGAGGGRRVALGGGLGTLLLVVVVMLLGGDPRSLLEMAGDESGEPQAEYLSSPEDERLKEMVGVILADTEEVWSEEFRKLGLVYEKPKLVLFTGNVRSGCGFASAQVGPFYCPADRTIYLDLTFFRELRQRFGAPGDFAQAYVVAHEVGHHVQKLLGTSDMVHQARTRQSEGQANAMSVRLELQADFYAGFWARKAEEKFRFLEQGDLEEAMNAANAIGDDTLQRQARGQVMPDSFTHGTSAQRVRWFRKGFASGDLREGDTFRVRDL